MQDWLRKQAGKIFCGERKERMAGSINRCLSELAELRQDLERELAERTWSVDKIVIEKLQADKVELNLGSIDIKELSGMLSIGFNYGGRLIRADSKGGGKTGRQSLQDLANQKTPASQPAKMTLNKDRAGSTGPCQPETTSKPEGTRPEKPVRTSLRPRLNIRYGDLRN